jgi:hypothetical protein
MSTCLLSCPISRASRPLQRLTNVGDCIVALDGEVEDRDARNPPPCRPRPRESE